MLEGWEMGFFPHVEGALEGETYSLLKAINVFELGYSRSWGRVATSIHTQAL